MISNKPLEKVLKNHFNFSSFREGQKEIITDVLRGHDVLGILSTGSGKSLCYQLPAKVLPGLTVVVSPLISLMIDQVKQLRAIQYKGVTTLNSFVDYQTRKNILKQLSSYHLIYVSPELLQQEEIIKHFQETDISLFVIDEAHCISQWGHEFRPDYLRLRSTIELLGNPPVLALSATATIDVQEDIMRSLNRPLMKKHIFSMDRKNIILSIQKVENDHEKLEIILNLIRKYNVPILIYFSSRKETQRVANYITERIPNKKTAFYHGGLDAIDRITIQQQFMNNQIDIICSTSAFGMGIDKENIRLIVHYHFPHQLESYIQESGRAGRDGKESVSLILYSPYDKILPEALIQHELPTEEDLQFIFQRMYNLMEENKNLPIDINEILIEFDLNDTQWRYTHYQLEKHGIINGNMIIYDKPKWDESLNKIKQHRTHRVQLKQEKLLEMIQWLEEERCLRKHLYEKFQSYYHKPIKYCCTNCDFLIDNWLPEQLAMANEDILTWEERLKTLLLGEHE